MSIIRTPALGKLLIPKDTFYKIQQLHPLVRDEIRLIFNYFHDRDIKLVISFGKVNPDEQNYLYQIGRTLPGTQITSHRAWSSYHNYGLALDVHIDNPTITWEQMSDENQTIFLKKIVPKFKENGWMWGNLFIPPRRNHFQKSYNLFTTELKALHPNPFNYALYPEIPLDHITRYEDLYNRKQKLRQQDIIKIRNS